MLLLGLLPACTPAPPDPWEGVPLKRGARPAWATPEMALEEAVETRGDGHRVVSRVLHPSFESGSNAKATWAVSGGRWTGTWRPEGGKERVWEIELDPNPERLAGLTTVLSPNDAEVVARDAPDAEHGAVVEGVITFGPQAFAFTCRGEGADLEPEGWCLAWLARTWVEVWEEGK